MTPVRYHSGAFPPLGLHFEGLLPYIARARTALGRYDGVLEGLTNPDVLLSPLMNKEAEQSSRIEGTQATLQEVFEFEAGNTGADAQRRADIQEIRNYRFALREAIRNLEKLPLSQRLIRRAHHSLMLAVRGFASDPGNYRKIQNWIGPQGGGEQDALFLPCPANEVPQHMDAWEQYMHSKQPDALVQAAIIHAEFEAIHPFLDGNGRLGRMMIPLFLFEKRLISRPSFYISDTLERNKQEYYDRLRAVSAHDDWNGWCRFFLKAVEEQADNNFDKAKAILTLHEESRPIVADITGSQHAISALDYFFTQPVFSSSQFRDDANIPNQTAGVILRKLRDHDFLITLWQGRGRKPEIFGFPKLLEIIS